MPEEAFDNRSITGHESTLAVTHNLDLVDHGVILLPGKPNEAPRRLSSTTVEPRSEAPVMRSTAPRVHWVRVDEPVERLHLDPDGPPPEAYGVEFAGGDVAADGLDRDREDLGGLGSGMRRRVVVAVVAIGCSWVGGGPVGCLHPSRPTDVLQWPPHFASPPAPPHLHHPPPAFPAPPLPSPLPPPLPRSPPFLSSQAHLFHSRIGVATRGPVPALIGVTMTLKKPQPGRGMST